MTGFGEARRQQDGVAVGVEVRTINSRYFKLTIRCGDGYGSIEPQIEALVRGQIKRGTIQVGLRIDRASSPERFRLNTAVLNGYRQQLQSLSRPGDSEGPVSLAQILLLPGVVDEKSSEHDAAERDWPLIEATLNAALENLAQMRTGEGASMAADLRSNCEIVARELASIEVRAPLVLESYRTRLEERLKKTLAEYEVTLDAAALIRELSIFAERSDISEEIVRLRSHLEQFETIMQLGESSGRKLEFLTQELFRETNTIGSKSNDIEIARHVIEIKTAIERIREMIQNVE